MEQTVTMATAPALNEETQERIMWTSADLDLLPQNGTRYEIIDGELFRSHAPHWQHQRISGRIFSVLDAWSLKYHQGQASVNPGLIYGEHDDVIPDVVWVSSERLTALMDEVGHLTGSPELVVEVLSPGAQNEQRDRETKLKLYSIKGVREYWIVDWRTRQVEVYRRERTQLKQAGTLLADDELTSPLLPDFAYVVSKLFD
jgi:Uma2 family endonuclease